MVVPFGFLRHLFHPRCQWVYVTSPLKRQRQYAVDISKFILDDFFKILSAPKSYKILNVYNILSTSSKYSRLRNTTKFLREVNTNFKIPPCYAFYCCVFLTLMHTKDS